ncbi:MAG TPA: glycosyltransferase [Desulfobacteraceae bacterium]|nr:glycosyltransferase [Desulfobacteraceae bacterium]
MTSQLEAYGRVAGQDVIDHLFQLSRPLTGLKVIHVNSTRVGGGVAEILEKLVPLMQEVGIETSWEVIEGNETFYQCTKGMHNGLQGNHVRIPEAQIAAYEEVNRTNAELMREKLEAADYVFIHDPQPAPLLSLCPNRRGEWVWRCHIDASHPYRPVWKYLRRFVRDYDASIFSLAEFAQMLPHPQYIIPPSIDPLSEKNIDLDDGEIAAVLAEFDIDPERPLLVQVSRFDRFKDPLGVIQAYKLVKKFVPAVQLVLAGGSATDDPEGEQVLREVQDNSAGDPDIHVLLLPPDAHRTINALQRAAHIVLQKSVKEGFGLTVTEAMWKGKPVIGGDTGGIRLQVINFNTGFRVNTPEGAALRIRYLFHNRKKIEEIGLKAREFVRDNFLITRHLREYLTLMSSLHFGGRDRIELG